MAETAVPELFDIQPQPDITSILWFKIFFMHVKQHFKLKCDAGRFGLYDVGSCCLFTMLWGQIPTMYVRLR